MHNRLSTNAFLNPLSYFLDEEEPFSSFLEDTSLDSIPMHIMIVAFFMIGLSFYLHRKDKPAPQLTLQDRLNIVEMADSRDLAEFDCTICMQTATNPVCIDNFPARIYCRECLLQLNRDPFTHETLHLNDIVALPEIDRRLQKIINKAESEYEYSNLGKYLKFHYKKSPINFLFYFLLYTGPIAINSALNTLRYSYLKSHFGDFAPIPILYEEYPNDLCPTLAFSDVEDIVLKGTTIVNERLIGRYSYCASMTVNGKFGTGYPSRSREEKVVTLLLNNLDRNQYSQKADVLKGLRSIRSEFTASQDDLGLVGKLSTNQYYCRYNPPSSSLPLIAFYAPGKIQPLCPSVDPVCPSLTLDDTLIVANHATYFTDPNATLAREVRNHIDTLEKTANPADTYYHSCSITNTNHGKIGLGILGILAGSVQEAKNRSIEFIKTTYKAGVVLSRSTFDNYFKCDYQFDSLRWENHTAYKSSYESLRFQGFFKPKSLGKYLKECSSLNNDLSFHKSQKSRGI